MPVLEIDGRQQPLVERQRLGAATRLVMAEDRLDQVRDHGAGHRAGRAGIEIGQQGDAFFAVERTDDACATRGDERAEFGRRSRHLDLEILRERNLLCEAGQKRNRQSDAAQGRVLNHDRDFGRVGDD